MRQQAAKKRNAGRRDRIQSYRALYKSLPFDPANNLAMISSVTFFRS